MKNPSENVPDPYRSRCGTKCRSLLGGAERCELALNVGGHPLGLALGELLGIGGVARGGGALALLEVGDGLPALNARGGGAGCGLAAAAEARVELAAKGLVAEEFVGTREELEVGGGVGVVGALIGVAQPRLRSVGLLDMLDGQRRAFLPRREAEYLVVVDVIPLLPCSRHGARREMPRALNFAWWGGA